MKPWQRLRNLPGVLLRDVPRYLRALEVSGTGDRSDPAGWIGLCNRIERLLAPTEGPGVICDWRWGSSLHAAEVMPFLGQRLLATALAEWPIRFADEPRVVSEVPKISFVFAHGGIDRLPQLQRTIRSIYAQEDVPCECIVVDQSALPALPSLPSPLIYRHISKDGVPAGWHKAWAYNVGARLARGSIIVFHDGDVCAPAGYAAELVNAIDQRGFAAASLQRLLFYMSQYDTQTVNTTSAIETSATPLLVFQNWKGGTIAVAREAFLAMGGFDEGFVDWGGEDDEFFDRCGALRQCRSGYLPFVHLWHPPQPDRKSSTNPNITEVMPWRMAMTHAQRLAELTQRRWGQVEAPDPLTGYKSRPGLGSRAST